MDGKEIKAALKEARETIKNKDFAACLKLCKSILKSDRENYMGLVFLGLALQEVGPREQAVHAFRKAILINPDQVLAWHGLANYYEKDDAIDSRKELMETYEKLLNIESDPNKFGDLCSKYVNVMGYLKELGRGATALRQAALSERLGEESRRTAWLAAVSLLTQSKEAANDDRLLELLTEALEAVCEQTENATPEHRRELLRALYRGGRRRRGELARCAERVATDCPDEEAAALEWQCRAYAEAVAEGEEDDEAREVCGERLSEPTLMAARLLELRPESAMGRMAAASAALSAAGRPGEAREPLSEVTTARPGLVHAWVLTSACAMRVRAYEEAAQAAARADKILQVTDRATSVPLRERVRATLISALARHSDIRKCRQAVELAAEIEMKNDTIKESLVEALIHLGELEEATQLIDELPEKRSVVLQAKLLHKQGDLEEALILLQTSGLPDSYERYMEKAAVLTELDRWREALVPLLHAAKLDPHSSECFVQLGRHYAEKAADGEKARRCYQKAWNLNPRSPAAGMGLSRCLREQKRWQDNLDLLCSVTGWRGGRDPGTDEEDESGRTRGPPVVNREVRWAWLQLGLHHLQHGEHNEAIESLRAVIRVEPDNAHYWECLADAYMARGSHTAAMKSFERADELSEGRSLYARLQVANVKLLIGLHDEAAAEFDLVLQDNARYVPALKGLAETRLNVAMERRRQQLLGSCRTNAQSALQLLTTALKERGDLSCLWKLVGDCCCLVAALPDRYGYLDVAADMCGGKGQHDDELERLSKDRLFSLSAGCYCRAISLCNSDETATLLWHDLACCYYEQAVRADGENGEEDTRTLLERCMQAAKVCCSRDPSRWQHWNVLGCAAANPAVRDYAVAQDAFIRAVRAAGSGATAALPWTNLGTLYRRLGEAALANRAFAQAQRSDPAHAAAWVGQALLAEGLAAARGEGQHAEEAMDLFRHSTQLGHTALGALGYARWVLRTIIEQPEAVNSYIIKDMHAVPVACDAVTFYLENDPEDACAWNMLGLLSERMGLTRSALYAFQQCARLLDEKNTGPECSEYLDRVLVNRGRKHTDLGGYEEAVRNFRAIREASFNSGCGLALALFKAEEYEQSYESYDTTMQWLTENETLQSHVLVALAAMAYMFRGPDSAKTLLFKSTQLKPPSRWGLYATMALGLLQRDVTLAQLVLKELEAAAHQEPEVAVHVAVLDAYAQLARAAVTGSATDGARQAVRRLCRYVHRRPELAELWLSLAQLLLLDGRQKLAKPASRCAQLAMRLGRDTRHMDVSRVWCVVACASLMARDVKEAVKAAQRAVHCYPNVAEAWAVLLSSLTALGTSSLQHWLSTTLIFIRTQLQCSEQLATWLSKLTV